MWQLIAAPMQLMFCNLWTPGVDLNENMVLHEFVKKFLILIAHKVDTNFV